MKTSEVETTEEMNEVDRETDSDGVSKFMNLLATPDHLAASLLWDQKVAAQEIHPVLLETAQQLFQRVERLGKLYQVFVEEDQTGNEAPLSGLRELYVGSANDKKVDAEMLWGQVELQNEALRTVLKSGIKKLSKESEKASRFKTIRLLEDLESESEQQQSEGEGTAERDSDESDEDEKEESADAKRIRERMERAMADMEEDDDEELENADDRKGESSKEREEDDDDVIDPAAEELNNGFFDLKEMEDFADEEEAYLPETAYGTEDPEVLDDKDGDKRTFHQKQREGAVDSGSDDDEEEEEEDLLTRKTSVVRRRKYREDDEIEALHKLYSKPSVKRSRDDEDDEEDDDVINMTAADLFGPPNKKYLTKWEEGSKNNRGGAKPREDDDSWDDFNFDRKDGKQSSGWNDEHDESSDEDRSGKGSNSDGEEHRDEEIPMQSKQSQKHQGPVGDSKKNKLEAQIEELEREMLAEKPWQMTGETTGTARPANSLLEATPEFEVATKMAPIITVEHTATLEEVIKKRVLEEDWDDVIPRELPDVGWHAKRGELPEVSQEKSKLGLGELYEREYLKKAVGYDVDAAEVESEEQKAKNEIKSLFANLCSKLDALSNYHFAPRPIENEADIRPVTKPAIAMEEVIPLHVSDARAVAPEQVYDKKHGRESVLRADSELEQPDRKRLRSSKKAARRKNRKQKQADEKLISRLQPGNGLNNPYEKRKMREELETARARGGVTAGKADSNEYGSSTTFFKRMEAQQATRGAKPEPAKADDSRKSSKSSSFKL